MTSFAISVGVDPNQLRVMETQDNFGSFETKEAAAQRIVEMTGARMSELRRSRSHARRILRAAAKGGTANA